jgi:hypothetical protein
MIVIKIFFIFTVTGKLKMKKKLIAFFVLVIAIFVNCILCADDNDTGGFTYTLKLYPAKITLHEMVYVCLTLENKTNNTLKGRRNGGRDINCFIGFMGSKEGDAYFYPLRRGLNVFFPPPEEILSGVRFIPVNLCIEFPELLTLKDYMSEQDPAMNANFIKDYVDSGKKCKLRIYLRDTGSYISNEFEITSRPAKEMAAIKKWYSRFSNFLADTSRISETSRVNQMTNEKWKYVPTVKDYQNFESQLSDGTLKNFVKFRRLLASIPEEKSRPHQFPAFEITKPFRELGDYLDTLHPFERDCLIVSAIDYFGGSEANVSNSRNPNYLRMLYLLVPKLPKSEREKYLKDVENEEYKNILLNSPEPVNKTNQNLSSTLPTITLPSTTTLSTPSSVSSPPASEQQTDLTNIQKTQPNKTSSWNFITVSVVILFILAIAGIIFVLKIFHKSP